MNPHDPILTQAFHYAVHATGETPYALTCLFFTLGCGIALLIRSMVRMWRLTASEIDAAGEVGEI